MSLPPQSNPADVEAVPAGDVGADAAVPPEPSFDDPEATNRLSAAIIVVLVLALLLCVALVLIAYRGR